MAIIEWSQERRCRNGFLTDYLDFTKEQESPEDYHFWVGLGTVGIALGRRCFVDRGYYTLYPNLYIVLVGESAITHKSTALSIGVNLIKGSLGEEVSFFSQKITTEALIYHLVQRYEETNTAHAVIHASEFSVFFGKSISDPTLLQTLTDLYDCPPTWSYTTRGRGIEMANDICVSMLAGSTPEWLKSCLPDEAIAGGFFSRLIPIFRSHSERKTPFPEDTLTSQMRNLRDNCKNDLQIISGISGQFQWETKAKNLFATWYEDENYNDPGGAPPLLRGYYGRKGDNIIKLAMIHSASRDSSKMIREQDVLFAVKALQSNEGYMEDIVKYLGKSEEGKKLEIVRELIERHGELKHSDLMRKVAHRLNKDEVKMTIDTLEEAGRIKCIITGSKSARLYKNIS